MKSSLIEGKKNGSFIVKCTILQFIARSNKNMLYKNTKTSIAKLRICLRVGLYRGRPGKLEPILDFSAIDLSV